MQQGFYSLPSFGFFLLRVSNTNTRTIGKMVATSNPDFRLPPAIGLVWICIRGQNVVSYALAG